MKKLVLLAVLAIGSPLFAAEPTYVIDTPTTGMLDYGAYNLNFRLFSDGGILTRLDFGVFKVVNLGFGWEVSKVIGADNVVVGPPTLSLRIRPFSGDMTLPAVVIGYDGQGSFYDRDNSEFLQKERGIFLAFGREIIFPGLNVTAGVNMNDFKKSDVFGFLNVDAEVNDKFAFLAEYDSINYLPDSRLSLGVRFFVTRDLNVDLAARDIGAAGRTAERIIRVAYVGKF